MRKKIGNRLLFGGNITKQPYMQNVNYKINGSLVNTNKIMNSTYWIGIHPRIEDDHINYMFENTKLFLKNENILITGSSGFLGNYISMNLSKKNKILTLDRKIQKKK